MWWSCKMLITCNLFGCQDHQYLYSCPVMEKTLSDGDFPFVMHWSMSKQMGVSKTTPWSLPVLVDSPLDPIPRRIATVVPEKTTSRHCKPRKSCSLRYPSAANIIALADSIAFGLPDSHSACSMQARSCSDVGPPSLRAVKLPQPLVALQARGRRLDASGKT